MSPVTTFFILFSVSLSVTAQLLLKKAMTVHQLQITEPMTYWNIMIKLVLNGYLMLGLFSYVMSAVVWLFVLSKVEVSRAYPFVGLGFIGTMLFAHWYLSEPLTTNKVVGTLLVMLGVLLISMQD